MNTDPLITSPIHRTFSFGERAVIGLFRGAGGLLGSSPSHDTTGIETLNAQLQAAFQGYFWSSQVFDSYEGNALSFREVGSQQAQTFISQFDQVGALGLVGYSAGGLSAIRTARGQASRSVDLLIQIESFDPLTGNSQEDEILPANVAKGINYYQLVNRFNPLQADFDPFDLQGARVVQGAENINAEAFFNDRTITHRNIDDKPKLQNQLLQDIETFVLQDLRFDPTGQLSLAGGAQLTNNILSLAPDINAQAGRAFIAEALGIDPDFSFQTRVEFRLPSQDLPGFSFWIQPTENPASGKLYSSVAIAFDPRSWSTQVSEHNAIAVLAPDVSPTPLAQAITSVDLDSGQPLTTWIDYDGLTDHLSIFLSDGLTQPRIPWLSYTLDLPAIVGSQAFFGFQTTVKGEARQAELLSWQLNTLSGSAAAKTSRAVRQKRLPFDYNGDGKSDLAFFRSFWEDPSGPVGEIGVWLLDGLAPPLTQASAGTFPFQADTFSPAFSLRNLDFNGDGKTDFLFEKSLGSAAAGFQLAVWLMEGTAPSDQAVIGTVAAEWGNPVFEESFAPRLASGKGAFGDFNGDRKTDILFLKSMTPSGDRDLAMWLMDGITPTAQVVLGNLGPDWLPFNLNDFNGDGKDDILFERKLEDGSIEYGLWLMAGVTATRQAVIGSVAAGEGWTAVDTNDFDGDGKADILFTRASPTTPGHTEYGVWLMAGTTPREQRLIGDSGAGWVLIDHNDFNGDGKVDLLFKQAGGARGDLYGIWLMEGAGFLTQAIVDTATAGWDYLGSADANGDGKADLEFVNRGTQQVASWLMNGVSPLSQGIIDAYDNPESPAGWLPPFTVPATS